MTTGFWTAGWIALAGLVLLVVILLAVVMPAVRRFGGAYLRVASDLRTRSARLTAARRARRVVG